MYTPKKSRDMWVHDLLFMNVMSKRKNLDDWLVGISVEQASLLEHA